MDLTMRGGLLGLLDELRKLHAHGASGVLGIVTSTTGSTYQKSGALVLLDAAGMRHGALSGGCLEPEVEARARAVLDTRRAVCVDIDTRSDDDLVFGGGTGCRGRIQLLLLPQPPGAPLTQALSALGEGVGSLTLDLLLTQQHTGSGSADWAGTRYTWAGDGHAIGNDPSGTQPAATLTLQSPPRILLYGAGPETSPLHLFLRRLGWRVTVVEHRGRWLTYARTAAVEHLIEQPPDSIDLNADAIQADAAIVMTHNFALDAAHLRRCAASSLGYIGLLGPAARREQLLTELGPEMAARLRGRLRSPVGLPLGGTGPEALALAITAELQQYLIAAGRLR